MADLNTFVARDSGTIRDGILRALRTGLIRLGVANPNVAPGSDYYVFASAIANQCVVAEANAILKADAVMPDTAVGDDLARIATVFGLSKQPAAGSVGTVVLSSSASTTVATGAQLIDGSGLAFQVTTGGTYANGASIPIAAVATGSATNHAAGDVLR
jgi:uncharacterized phage protein gp47/JayE